MKQIVIASAVYTHKKFVIFQVKSEIHFAQFLSFSYGFNSLQLHKVIHFQMPHSKWNPVILNLSSSMRDETNCHSTSCLHSLKDLFTLRLSPKFCSFQQFLSLNNGLKSLQPHKTIHFEATHSKLNVIMPNLLRSVQNKANYHSTSYLYPLKIRSLSY